MTDAQDQAINKLNEAIDLCKAQGLDVIATAILYAGQDDTHFSTRISINEKPDKGITDDHVFLDVMREITQEWDKIAHVG